MRKKNKLHIIPPNGSQSTVDMDRHLRNISIHNSLVVITTKDNDKEYVQLFSLTPDQNLDSPITVNIPTSSTSAITYYTDDGFIIAYSHEEYVRINGTIQSTIAIPQKSGYKSRVIGYHNGYVLVSMYDR